MAYKILIADDDDLLRDLLQDILEQEGYEVITAEDGIRALELFRQRDDLNLVILDIMMPGRGGMEVLKDIRTVSRIPVIMLTALGDEESELQGFENGACDYVKKPFHAAVLIARVKAALHYKGANEVENKNIWKEGRLEINTEGCRVTVDGKTADLTNKEYQLLLYLVENKNIVLTRDQMVERIWGFDYEGDIRTVDTHIKMLRTDLGVCSNYIRTVRGIGYTFTVEEET